MLRSIYQWKAPKIENLETTTLKIDLEHDLQVQIKAMKAYFMNKIFELRSEIEGLKKQTWHRSNNKNNLYVGNNLEILKVQNSPLQKKINLLNMNYNKIN